MTAAHVVRRQAPLWLGAAALPFCAWAAVVFGNLEPWSWFSIPAGTMRGLAGDAQLYIAGCLIVVAPVAGVTIASRQRTGNSLGPARDSLAIWPLFVAVLLFVATSALLAGLAWGSADAQTLAFVATSHVTLAAVGLALAGFGAFCGAVFRDPLDAIACSLTIVLLAAGGLLVAGALVADAPRSFIDVALTASPLVAIASAAHIDIVRMEILYRISPLAHVQVNYPEWYAASGWYSVVAAVCFLGLKWKSRTWRTAQVS